MIICSSVKASFRSLLQLSGHFQLQMRGSMDDIILGPPSGSCCLMYNGHSSTRYSSISLSNTSAPSSLCCFRAFRRVCDGYALSKKSQNKYSLMTGISNNLKGSQATCFGYPFRHRSTSARLSVPKGGILSKLKSNIRCDLWSHRYIGAGLIFSLLLCYSNSKIVCAEVSKDKGDEEDSSGHVSHARKVYSDYSIIGIPGDGRCLFRSVAHGACLSSGKPPPSERFQRELADELRARVAKEFIKRRDETEWFIEGDFDTYVSQIQKPHVWGGEPELLMLSHVLRMPITVYMRDEDSGGLISIAEYGQEYGKDSPIRVLYHGYGHYDALLIPGKKGGISRL